MAKRDFSFSHSLRVRFAEVDAHGHVFFGHYLTYFDTAISAYLRHLECREFDPIKPTNAAFYVVNAQVNYHAPIGFDEVLTIYVRVSTLGTTSLTFYLEIYIENQNNILASGHITWIYVDLLTQRSAPLPPAFVAHLRRHESDLHGSADHFKPPQTHAIQSTHAHLYLHFAEQQALLGQFDPNPAREQTIQTAAVVGTGLMAVGIAITLANAGIAVRLIGRSDAALERAQQAIQQHYAKRVAQGRLSEAAATSRGYQIVPTTADSALREVDIVIEAVLENIDIKRAIFINLGQQCHPDTILASCTSALDLNLLADATGRPQQVIGCHFLNPAYTMRALEIVQTDKTAQDIVLKTQSFARKLGKIPVLVTHNPDKPGFVGNRLLRVYLSEAEFLLEEGALPQQVDAALMAFGMAMGPFAMSDMAGLDVGWYSRQYYANQRPKNERYSTLCDELCERGRFGQKTGAGWYRYSAGSHTPQPDPDVEAWICDASRRLGITRRPIAHQEVIQRCIGALINEARCILSERLVQNAYLIDLLWVYGYGFPRWRGGPLFYADTLDSL